MEWNEQYKHPSWQKKRLEMLKKSEFTCSKCWSSDDQLHVHHKRYVKGRKMWEYSDSELEVLCGACHETAHADKEILYTAIAMLNSESLNEITSLISGYCASVNGPTSADLSGPYCYACQRIPFVAGVAAGKISGMWNLDKAKEVLSVVEKFCDEN